MVRKKLTDDQSSTEAAREVEQGTAPDAPDSGIAPAAVEATLNDATLVAAAKPPADPASDPGPVAEAAVADAQAIVSNDEPPAPDMKAEPATPPTVVQSAQPRRSGFLPLTLGGALAAALGFGAASFLFMGDNTAESEALTRRIVAQDEALAALESRVAALPVAPDIAPLEQDLAQLRADLVAQTDGLRPGLATLTQRIAALERVPGADGTLSDTALAAWQSELDALRADLAAQSARTDDLAAEAAARIDATATELAEVGAQAAAAGIEVTRRAALSRVLAALETGAPFAEPLAEATTDAPAALSAVATEGVPTMARLTDSFPEAARAALIVARAEGLAGEPGGFTGFLRNQFNVRSTTPQDGDTPDAILSRAEAALHDSRLDDALSEVAALPEVVRGAMSGWLSLAEIRVAALAAAQTLSDTLSAN